MAIGQEGVPMEIRSTEKAGRWALDRVALGGRRTRDLAAVP